MNKKKNVLRRNSGFLVGCLLAAGASYFTADAVMTKDLTALLQNEEETETQQPAQTDTAETLAPEESESRTFETDPFTVTASGNVVKGAESEVPQQKKESETEENEPETSAEDQEDGSDASSDGDPYEDDSYSEDDDSGEDDGYYDDGGSYDDGGYYDDGSGYYDDGSYYGDGYSDGSGGQSIEIQDPGNGDYSYDGGSGGGSGDNGQASTPDDVILWGISSRYIGEEELYNYDLATLRLIRNEIFALHGRIFTSQDLIDYFSQKSWYVPMYSPEEFDANMFDYLNDYEEANLNVIMNYEAALGGY